MRDRNARVCGRGHAGGHAGNNLERHAGIDERLRLLSAAAEHERIAALQPHDRAAVLRVRDEQAVDLVLGHGVTAGFLADVGELRVAAGAVEQPGRDEAVVEDHVGACDQLGCAHCRKPRIAGPGADEVHGPWSRAHGPSVPAALRSSSPAPAVSILRATSAPAAAGSDAGPAYLSVIHSVPSGSPA